MSFSSDSALITNQLPQTVNLPDIKDEQEFSDKIESLFRDVADSVNGKEDGVHALEEKASGSRYYSKDNEAPLRNVYRKIIDLVSLNGGTVGGSDTVQFTHNITNLFESCGIYAHCTSVDGIFFTSVFPDLRLNRTSVLFTNPYSEALIQCDIVCNFLKN